jgi:hypothetical protein
LFGSSQHSFHNTGVRRPGSEKDRGES